MQVGPTGCVVGIDHMKELVDMSQKNIEKDAPHLLKKEVIKLVGELWVFVINAVLSQFQGCNAVLCGSGCGRECIRCRVLEAVFLLLQL